ncbi:MAG: hypothetical protein DRI84_03270 [Bacteroidetes bacterium]|nr:MAG: hypothetical protein DRI84_03270 [Bacteroidota bacterium]
MKAFRLYALAILLIGLSISTYAGDKFGIRAGYQASNLYNGSTSLYGVKHAFYVGVFKDVKMLPFLHFGMGLDYFQNGSYEDASNNISLHYLSVPLNLKLKLGPFFVLAGAAPSIKISESWTDSGTKFKPSSDLKSNSFDLPVFAGIGFKVAIVSFEARYYYGTIDVNNNTLSGFDGYNNQYLQLGMAVSI